MKPKRGAYYNEIDAYAAQWLRNLIAAGHIAAGDVDERSITEVKAEDVRDYAQCHFFAGIGIWSLALRQAGWGDSRPVWTASLPCQPFSSAGKQQGHADRRHLAPVWLGLVRECRPATCFGEQVAAAIGMGWLDSLFISLERYRYACGALVFSACSVGAPHIRERLYWVADAESSRARRGNRRQSAGHARLAPIDSGLLVAELGNAKNDGCEGGSDTANRKVRRPIAATRASATGGFWADAEWLACLDGKARPAKPGIFPLAARCPGRVGMLRAAGNCIVAPQAAEFIRAFTGETPARVARPREGLTW